MTEEYFTRETADKLEQEIIRRLEDNLWACIGCENAVSFVVGEMKLDKFQSERLADLLRTLSKSCISVGIELESPGFVERFSGKPISKIVSFSL